MILNSHPMSSNHLIEELKKQIGNFQATAKREG